MYALSKVLITLLMSQNLYSFIKIGIRSCCGASQSRFIIETSSVMFYSTDILIYLNLIRDSVSVLNAQVCTQYVYIILCQWYLFAFYLAQACTAGLLPIITTNNIPSFYVKRTRWYFYHYPALEMTNQ